MEPERRVKIRVDEGGTVCECTILPAPPGHPPLAYPDLVGMLDRHGVRYGLDESAILEHLILAETATAPVTFVAARAIPARNGSDGRITLHGAFPHEFRFGNRTVLSGARPRAGELLLSIDNSDLEGVDGISVTGVPLKAEPGRPVRIKAGKNVKIVEESGVISYYATAEGMAVLDNRDFLHIRPISDGWFNALFSADNLSLTLSLYAPSGGGRFVEADDILAFLRERGLPLDGRKRLELERLIARLGRDGSDIEDHLLLQGTPPVHGEDSRLEFKVSIEPLRLFGRPSDPEGKVDFRAVLAINAVSEGQLVAELHPPTPPVRDGRDIFGRTIPAEPGKDKVRLKPGKNIRTEGRRFYATVNGQIKRSGDVFWVSPVFSVPGDLDLSIGHVDFVGDVAVAGSVPDGFRIRTDENLLVGRNIGAAEITTGRDLLVCGGIINRKKSRIIVRGDLHARFIEYSGGIEVHGNVFVDDYILQSDIRAGGRIVVAGSGKGQIIGGELWALHGVVARVIGNESEIPTRVCVGRHRFLQRALHGLERRLAELSAAGGSSPDLSGLLRRREALLKAFETPLPCHVRVEKTVFPKTELWLHDRKLLFKTADSFRHFAYDPGLRTVVTGRFDDPPASAEKKCENAAS